MNPTDHWDALKAAGAVPPPSPEALTHARSRLSSRRRTVRRLVPVVSLGVAAAIVAGVLLVGPGAQLAGPRFLEDGSASCAYGYSPERLRESAFAFDGTVVAIDQPTAAYGPYAQMYSLVTFTVNEWFKPGEDGEQTRVLLPVSRTPRPSGDYAYGFPYEVGSRLLITGAVNPDMASSLVNQLAWACNFSRFYDKRSAREWRETLGR